MLTLKFFLKALVGNAIWGIIFSILLALVGYFFINIIFSSEISFITLIKYLYIGIEILFFLYEAYQSFVRITFFAYLDREKGISFEISQKAFFVYKLTEKKKIRKWELEWVLTEMEKMDNISKFVDTIMK